jgi:hypothetical protein
MILSAEQESKVMAEVAHDIANRIWDKIEHALDDVVCISIPRVSGALELSTARANSILTEFVDFGPRDKRVTLRALKAAIEARTVKKKTR